MERKTVEVGTQLARQEERTNIAATAAALDSSSALLSERDATLDRGGVEFGEQRLVGFDLRLVRLTRESAAAHEVAQDAAVQPSGELELAGAFALAGLVLWLARSPTRSSGAPSAPEGSARPLQERAPLVPAPESAVETAREEPARKSVLRGAAPPLDETAETAPPVAVPVLTVAGRVVDLEERPIEGAELFAADSESREDHRVALSDERGLFRGELCGSKGGLDFTLLADHFRGARIEVSNPRGGELQLGTFRLAPGSEVAGQVLDEAGRPLSGALVSWLPSSAFPVDAASARREGFGTELEVFVATGLESIGYGTEGEDGFEPRTLSAADGRFRLRGIPLGEGFLVGWKKGRSHGWSEVLEAGAAATRDQELVLPPSDTASSRIDGIVRDPSGAPVAGIVVRAHSAQVYASVLSEADGAFLLDRAWTGPVDLGATDERQRWAPAVLQGVAPGTHALDLVLGEPIWLTVRLEDAEQRPIAWGHVRMGGTMQDTGRDGLARIQKPAGVFSLEGSAPGYCTQSFGPFEPSSVGDELALTLAPGQALRGRVVFRGRPVAGARLDLAGTSPPGSTLESSGAAQLEHPFLLTGSVDLSGCDGTSDASGAFVLTLHTDGWHSLRVEAEGFPTQVFGPFQFAREAGFEGLELELERGGALEGHVRLAAGTEPHDLLVGVSNGWSFVRAASLAADGSYRIQDLAPGAYQVRACVPPIAARQELSLGNDTDEPLTWDCRIAAEATTRFDLDLSLEGSVVLAGQLMLVGAEPRQWEAQLFTLATQPSARGSLRARAALDAQGHFDLELSRAGRYRLALEGYPLWIAQDVELLPGQNEWSYRSETGKVRVRSSGAAAERPEQLRFVGHGEGSLEITSVSVWNSYLLRDAGAGEWVIDAPPGPGRLESLPFAPFAEQHWTLVRELSISAGVEQVIELP